MDGYWESDFDPRFSKIGLPFPKILGDPPILLNFSWEEEKSKSKFTGVDSASELAIAKLEKTISSMRKELLAERDLSKTLKDKFMS